MICAEQWCMTTAPRDNIINLKTNLGPQSPCRTNAVMIQIIWPGVRLECFIKNRACVSNEPYSSFDKESTGQQAAPTENLHRCAHLKREVQKPDTTPDLGVRRAHCNTERSSYRSVWSLTKTWPSSHFKTCGFIVYPWVGFLFRYMKGNTSQS